MPRSNESFLLSGWLFADLLLALAVLFLAANTATIKPLPPTLIVNPTVLDINSHTAPCTVQRIVDTSIAQCDVTIEEAKVSQGDVNWSVSSDISQTIKYTIGDQAATSGRLSPGQQKKLTISGIPCQNGSFTFNAARVGDNKISAAPLVVQIKCTPPKERLDFAFQTIPLTVKDADALRHEDPTQVNDIKQQLANTRTLQGRKVGLAVAYGGAPTTNDIADAQGVAREIYKILNSFQNNNTSAFSRSSFYVPLYNLSTPKDQVQLDVYFFTER